MSPKVVSCKQRNVHMSKRTNSQTEALCDDGCERATPEHFVLHCSHFHGYNNAIMSRCHRANNGRRREAEGERDVRVQDAGFEEMGNGKVGVSGRVGGKLVGMTLLEITTATLNVLHYKICDKTLLWGGLLTPKSHRKRCPLSSPFHLCMCVWRDVYVCFCVCGVGGRDEEGLESNDPVILS